MNGHTHTHTDAGIERGDKIVLSITTKTENITGEFMLRNKIVVEQCHSTFTYSTFLSIDIKWPVPNHNKSSFLNMYLGNFPK